MWTKQSRIPNERGILSHTREFAKQNGFRMHKNFYGLVGNKVYAYHTKNGELAYTAKPKMKHAVAESCKNATLYRSYLSRRAKLWSSEP